VAERILITGARAMAALDIARDFRRLGYEVHVADCSPARAARMSRAIAACHRYRSPRSDFAGFSADLTQLCTNIAPKLVVPSCEEVFHLAQLPMDHPVHRVLFAPPLAQLRQLHDKAAFAKLCGQLKLPVPESHPLTSPQDVAAFTDCAAHWVFKPCFSRFGSETLIAPNPDALSKIEPSQQTPWVAQALARGEEMCFHAIAHAGKLTAFCAYRGTWRLRAGASLGFAACPQAESQPLLDIAQTLAAGLSLTGQFGCDVIVDNAGQPWLIECNPRATSGVHLVPQDGRLAMAFLNADAPLLMPESAQPLYLAPAMASFALSDALMSGRFAAWQEVMRAGRDVVAIGGDRAPIIGAVLDGLEFMIRGASRGMSATAATTLEIEWNGETHDQPIA
jgi:hypothetical protein